MTARRFKLLAGLFVAAAACAVIVALCLLPLRLRPQPSSPYVPPAARRRAAEATAAPAPALQAPPAARPAEVPALEVLPFTPRQEITPQRAAYLREGRRQIAAQHAVDAAVSHQQRLIDDWRRTKARDALAAQAYRDWQAGRWPAQTSDLLIFAPQPPQGP